MLVFSQSATSRVFLYTVVLVFYDSDVEAVRGSTPPVFWRIYFLFSSASDVRFLFFLLFSFLFGYVVFRNLCSAREG